MNAWLRDLMMYSFSFVLSLIALVIPKSKRLILFGAFAGKRFADNSALVYEFIQRKHPELRPVWLTNSQEVFKKVRAEKGEVYYRRSLKGIWLSLRTPIYLTSHGVKDVLMFIPLLKRPKHIYLHHGIPLRRGWLDLKNAPRKSVLSSKQKITTSNCMIAPSKFAASQQNKLLPIGLDKFELTGLPRNDIFFDARFNADKFKDSLGLAKHKKLIVYCPTWRPWGATKFFPFEDVNLETLNTWLKQHKAIILLRPHHVDLKDKSNAKFWQEIKYMEGLKLMTHDICPNVNQLARISDALITDYSSMYYDYILLDKPVVFLPYDLERYEKEIGFYPNYAEITHGAKPTSQIQFLNVLEDLINNKDTYKEQRNELRDLFYDHQDGRSTERVVELIKSIIR